MRALEFIYPGQAYSRPPERLATLFHLNWTSTPNNDMLSSLFPRSSIYRSLDDTDHAHGHGFDTGNTALFNADELEEGTDHAAGITSVNAQRGHRPQPSLPDPFEHMPKTGTVPPQLPLIRSAPTSPGSAAGSQHDDRGTGEEATEAARTFAADPFTSHQGFSDDPMTAMSERFNSPYGTTRHDAATPGHNNTQGDIHLMEEAGPPKSM